MTYFAVPPSNTSSGSGSGGDSSPVWVQTVRARSTLLNGGAAFINGEYFTAFDDGNYTTTSAAGGSATISTSAATTLTVQSGTTNGGDAKVLPIGSPAFVSDLTTKPIYGYWKLQFINTLVDNDIAWVGFADPGLTHKAAFGYATPSQITGGSTTNFSMFNGASGTASSATADATIPHEIEAYGNGLGTLTWLVDQVVVGTSTITVGYGANPAMVFGQANMRQTGGLLSTGFAITRVFARF